MSDKTYIKGEDAALEVSIAKHNNWKK